MNLTNRLTFIDLFAGCGGLSLGMEKAGFFPLYVNELNKDAIETYLVNREQHYPHLRRKYNSRDIKEVISKEGFFECLLDQLQADFNRDFRENSVDVVAGGPPCQGFSGIGIRRSYSVDKVQLPSNHLFQDMAFFIHKMRPKLFLFENVEGLLRAKWRRDGQKGEIFKDILKTFSDIPNYSVRHKLVYAKDYGVPQNRPRVLLIGKRQDIHGDFSEDVDAMLAGYLPYPTSDYPDIQDIFSDLVDKKFEYGGSTARYPSSPKNQWQENIRTLPDGEFIACKGDPPF